MSKKEANKKLLPPYLPYRTFSNFIEELRIALPPRIDRSLMKSMSGGMQSQLMSALAYLNLIDSETNVPTEKLPRLVHSSGAGRQRVLKDILISSYKFLSEGGFQLDRATARQLQERFEQTGMSGDTQRKAIAFFIKAAEDAGLGLSPHIKRGPGPKKVAPKPKTQTISPPTQYITGAGGIASGESFGTPTVTLTPPPEDISLEKILLSKFPSFDPAWSEEVQKKWFDAFRELRAQFKKT
jgi:hypothetical protein